VGGVPVVANGVVYHSARDRILALNASDGQTRWEFAPDGDAYPLGTPIIGTGGLYVAGHDAVYALEEGSA
jgi:outer membrane protein assembly factor BamB